MRCKSSRQTAFTLIELLVVIAIIVALIAILLPSMNRAIYISQLVQCGSGQRQMGIGVQSYAADFQTFYPYRMTTFGVPAGGGVSPQMLKVGHPTSGVIWDDRPMLEPYTPLELYQCPLSPGVREGAESIEQATAEFGLFASYELYFGFQFDMNDASTRRARVSDRPQYNGRYYRVLAADVDNHWNVTVPVWYTSHPDRDGMLVTQQLNTATGWYHIWRRSTVGGGGDRGMIDRNFLYEDGSVELMTDLIMEDPRLERLPAFGNNTGAQVYSYLPAN